MATRLFSLLLPLLATACGSAWNDPYPAAARGQNVLYTAFTDRPKHLDPVQSYSEDEGTIIGQIYEPPLQYHYLKRPYEVVAATATEVPRPVYLDAAGRPLPADVAPDRIAFSDYVIRIQPGIRYQPHPAFARGTDGEFLFHQLGAEQLADKYSLRDFPATGSRELVAEDYVYAIKRLAHPRLHSPIFGLMSEYIVGLTDLAASLKAKDKTAGDWLDLRHEPLAGVVALDRYTYRIRVKGRYPQFIYWLTMHFFAPMPWEAEKFHNQPGMAERNLVLD